MFGLEKRSEEELRAILIMHGVEKAIIFGSRGRGDYKKNSDIDIAVFGDFTSTEINLIRWDIEESRIIYLVDLVHFEKVTDEEFKNSILEGKEFKIY
ncbi:nucleotidyltransferase domain-containing protein [uncultured Ilyobacter sp.]|uniref:nucleotidyltransferase family protein n=1 Tax=uncultured Ilyobacter sp. TaxID=544433 RepID=UPI0029C815D8|nr:nucleotidyltransferase domain-containing protein [uncultured Ilyobacter sp.]